MANAHPRIEGRKGILKNHLDFLTQRAHPSGTKLVNSLIAGDRVISADPFGPVDGSVDKFKEPFAQSMNAIGLQVDFVDDWYPYHEWWGEVHCGTNAVRTPAVGDWWAVD